jgi:hypothetical protein
MLVLLLVMSKVGSVIWGVVSQRCAIVVLGAAGIWEAQPSYKWSTALESPVLRLRPRCLSYAVWWCVFSVWQVALHLGMWWDACKACCWVVRLMGHIPLVSYGQKGASVINSSSQAAHKTCDLGPWSNGVTVTVIARQSRAAHKGARESSGGNFANAQLHHSTLFCVLHVQQSLTAFRQSLACVSLLYQQSLIGAAG